MTKRIYLFFISFLSLFLLASCGDKRDFSHDESALTEGVFAREFLNNLTFDTSHPYLSSDDGKVTHIEVFMPENRPNTTFFRTIDIQNFVKEKRSKSIHLGPLFYYHPFFNNALAYSNKVLLDEDLLTGLQNELLNFNKDVYSATKYEITKDKFKEDSKTLKIHYLPVKYNGYEAVGGNDVAKKVVTSYLLVPYYFEITSVLFDDESYTQDKSYKVLTFDSSQTYLEKKKETKEA